VGEADGWFALWNKKEARGFVAICEFYARRGSDLDKSLWSRIPFRLVDFETGIVEGAESAVPKPESRTFLLEPTRQVGHANIG
jgi:hypothetical protein